MPADFNQDFEGVSGMIPRILTTWTDTRGAGVIHLSRTSLCNRALGKRRTIVVRMARYSL
jgi:UV DNA damage repair endonuclease